MPAPECTDSGELGIGFDVTRPNIARVYDYWLGGKDNFAADRREARRLMEIWPLMPKLARDNRQFITRAVTWAAGQGGIRQFLDVGSGLPTRDNTHEAAQRVRPDSRVVYADNDPMVVTHAQALLAGPDVEAIEGDLRDPERILGDPVVRGLIRPDEPVAVVLALVLHFFPPRAARDIIGTFASWMPPGSCLIISVGCGDRTGDELVRAYSAAPLWNHSPEEVTGFFRGLPMVPPGLVDAENWRPGWETVPSEHRGGRILAGVACKPLAR